MKCSSDSVEFIEGTKLLIKASRYSVCLELYWKHLIRNNLSSRRWCSGQGVVELYITFLIKNWKYSKHKVLISILIKFVDLHVAAYKVCVFQRNVSMSRELNDSLRVSKIFFYVQIIKLMKQVFIKIPLYAIYSFGC